MSSAKALFVSSNGSKPSSSSTKLLIPGISSFLSISNIQFHVLFERFCDKRLSILNISDDLLPQSVVELISSDG